MIIWVNLSIHFKYYNSRNTAASMDVQKLFEVTDEEAQEFLENTAKAIQEQAVQVGWNVIEVHAGMANLKKVKEG